MEVNIHVTYQVTLEEDDAEKIETGEMNPNDIDWFYYIDEPATIDLDGVEVL